MTVDATLKAERREGTGKSVARKLRAAGKLPAVVYGGEGETDHISLDSHDTEYLFQRISVDNSIVSLTIDGQKEPVRTLVREIQTHPWKATLLHVDFLRIQEGVAVDVEIPVDLVGTPVGVQMSGGILEQIIHDLPIRCIPSKIPEVISIDVSGLDVNDSLHVSDLTMDEGVEVTIPGDRTVCLVAMPRVEVEETEEEEPVEGLADDDEERPDEAESESGDDDGDEG